jgi:hypothetical protein
MPVHPPCSRLMTCWEGSSLGLPPGTFALGHFVVTAYPLVVLANEPRSYRSLLAAELPFLRPNLRVVEVSPADLDNAVATLHPSIVICSRLTRRIYAAKCSIVKLYCDEVDTFIQDRDGTVVNPRLPDILRAIDRALPSAQGVHRSGNRRTRALPVKNPRLKRSRPAVAPR